LLTASGGGGRLVIVGNECWAIVVGHHTGLLDASPHCVLAPRIRYHHCRTTLMLLIFSGWCCWCVGTYAAPCRTPKRCKQDSVFSLPSVEMCVGYHGNVILRMARFQRQRRDGCIVVVVVTRKGYNARHNIQGIVGSGSARLFHCTTCSSGSLVRHCPV
jgi:hypothetical protein